LSDLIDYPVSSFQCRLESSSFPVAQQLNCACGAGYNLGSSLRWNDGVVIEQLHTRMLSK
jgi:hypothetical protein